MSLETKKIKKTVILAGYRCNNHCRFCFEAEKRNLPQGSTKDIFSAMIDARKRKRGYLELIGGELTIRPDILDLISFAKEIGFRSVVMATNGRMFSYRLFARKIINTGISEIIFSIHGHNAKIHDSLTRVKGSFDQLVRGINNLRDLGFNNLASNTIIVKQNYEYLLDTGKFIYNSGIRNSEFIFVDPTCGNAYHSFKKLVPRISGVAPYAYSCLDFGKNKKDIKHWSIRYVPLCFFTDRLSQVSELIESNNFHTEHLALDFQDYNVEVSRAKLGRIKPKKCKGCRLYSRCEGIWKEYLKHYGDSELKPILN